MTTWVTVPVEMTRLYSPVGLRLLDELTNEPPLGAVQAILDILDANGNWRQTDVQAAVTPSGVVSYPGLERHAIVTGLPSQKYRVRLSADLYIPYYLTNADGIQFSAYPYNDDNPPAVIAKLAMDTPLLPAPNYPFASHIPVLRGAVVDTTGKPVPNAYVTQSNNERALTDQRGTFALPLRWLPANTPSPVDATDQRSGRTGTISIQLPSALNQSQKISIS
jgi:hypothetical protein